MGERLVYAGAVDGDVVGGTPDLVGRLIEGFDGIQLMNRLIDGVAARMPDTAWRALDAGPSVAQNVGAGVAGDVEHWLTVTYIEGRVGGLVADVACADGPGIRGLLIQSLGERLPDASAADVGAIAMDVAPAVRGWIQLVVSRGRRDERAGAPCRICSGPYRPLPLRGPAWEAMDYEKCPICYPGVRPRLRFTERRPFAGLRVGDVRPRR